MERSRRFILFLAAALSATPVFFKGHPPSRQDGAVAFFSSTSSGVTVRVKGMVRTPGVYTFPDGATMADVIILTGYSPHVGMPVKSLPESRLGTGDVVEVAWKNSQLPDITVTRMKAGECMLLGIPLHPDRMDLEDWDSLPGIGPKLARNIIEDRQNNGEFRYLEAVQRVPGMGEKKLLMVRKYF